jgi:hypothetical protein
MVARRGSQPNHHGTTSVRARSRLPTDATGEPGRPPIRPRAIPAGSPADVQLHRTPSSAPTPRTKPHKGLVAFSAQHHPPLHDRSPTTPRPHPHDRALALQDVARPKLPPRSPYIIERRAGGFLASVISIQVSERVWYGAREGWRAAGAAARRHVL